jgi:hypothetical protein
MKKLKDWKKFNEFFDNTSEELEGLYEEGADAITDAANYLATPGTEEWNEINNEDPHTVIDLLRKNGSEEALSLAEEIESINKQIIEEEKRLND